MSLLEKQKLDSDFLVSSFLPRGLSLSAHRTYLSGTPSSGKTSLALRQAKPACLHYVNLSVIFDPIAKREAKEALLNLGREIELVIIDNYELDFLDSVMLASLESKRLIVIGSHALKTQDAILSSFSTAVLRGLSFDEYLAGNTKNLGLENLLSNFIQQGNSPAMLSLNALQQPEKRYEIMRLALGEDCGVFRAMLSLQSLKLTTNAIYTRLKAHSQLSKDRLYPLINRLAMEHRIFICEHRGNANSKHRRYKLYFYDFSLSALADSRHFLRIYENMVFLELLHLGLDLHYDDYFDFIDEERGLVFFCMPFSSLEHIKSRIAKVKNLLDNSSNKLIVISMNLHVELEERVIILDFASLCLLDDLVKT